MTRLPRAGEQSRRGELVDRSRRAVQWLQPGLVVKRWVLASALGFVLALLGAAIWADLKPIYWILTTVDDLLRVLAGAGREFTGPLVLLVGIGLVLLGQSRSFGSIQRVQIHLHGYLLGSLVAALARVLLPQGDAGLGKVAGLDV